MSKKILTIFILMILTLFSSYAEAQKGSLTLQMTAEKEIIVVNEKGEKEIKLIPVSSTTVIPGDEVIYTIYYENIGKEPATDAVISNPLPEHMLYTNGSAEGKGTKVEFSVDGGRKFDIPENLKIKGADGKERLAGSADYTHVRWLLIKPVEPGSKGSVLFRAKVK